MTIIVVAQNMDIHHDPNTNAFQIIKSSQNCFFTSQLFYLSTCVFWAEEVLGVPLCYNPESKVSNGMNFET